MDAVIRHFWSLYLDYLKDFEEIKYKGYSLTYLCGFHSFVLNNRRVWDKLGNPSFTDHIKRRINDPKEIQEAYDNYYQQHTRKEQVDHTEGRVVIHVDKLLRFPALTFLKYFNPDSTVQLKLKGTSRKHIIANHATHKKANKAGSKNKFKKRSKKTAAIDKSLAKNRLIRQQKLAKTNRLLSRIPSYFIFDYKKDMDEEVKKVQEQARKMMQLYQSHHLYGDEEFQKWFFIKIRAVINYLEMYKGFLNDVHASCIILSNTNDYKNRILALIAAEKGIPTICMQHGIISSEIGYTPKIAKIDAVYGEFEIDWFTKRGVTEGTFEIIGHPRFDQVKTRPKVPESKFHKTLETDPKKKTIMIAVRGNIDLDNWRRLITKISSEYNMNILIKNYPTKAPHPLTKEFDFVYPTKDYNIYDMFPHVDAVVTYPSTVGLEAMLANRPVFILNKYFDGYTGYYDSLGELAQTDPEKLAEVIIRYFKDSHFQKYADQIICDFLGFAYPNQGKSGARLKQLINRLRS